MVLGITREFIAPLSGASIESTGECVAVLNREGCPFLDIRSGDMGYIFPPEGGGEEMPWKQRSVTYVSGTDRKELVGSRGRFSNFSVQRMQRRADLIEQDRLYRCYLPLKRTEFGQSTVVTCIGRHHSYAQTPRAHCNKSVVGQSSLSNLFVTISDC